MANRRGSRASNSSGSTRCSDSSSTTPRESTPPRILVAEQRADSRASARCVMEPMMRSWKLNGETPAFSGGRRWRRRPTREDRLIARMLAPWLDEELARQYGGVAVGGSLGPGDAAGRRARASDTGAQSGQAGRPRADSAAPFSDSARSPMPRAGERRDAADPQDPLPPALRGLAGPAGIAGLKKLLSDR